MISGANNRIVNNTLFLSIRMVIVLLISLYTTRVLIEALGVIDYGINNVVAGFVTICAFISTSMAASSQRFYNFELGRNGIIGAKKVFNTSVIIQVLSLIIIVILVEFVGLWYINNKMIIPSERIYAANWVFQMAIVSLSFSIIQVPFHSAIMAHEKMNYYAIVNIIEVIFKLIIVICIAKINEDRLILYSTLLAGVSVVSFCLYFFYARYNFEEVKFEYNLDLFLFKSMLCFSGWNLFGTFARTMRTQGVSIVLNIFFGPLVNAAQGIANQVNAAFIQLVTNLSIAARPQIVNSYAIGNYVRTINLMFSVSKITLYLLYMAALPILIELRYILSIWLGDNIPNYTYTFIIFIVITTFVTNIHTITSSVVHATGRMKLYQLVCGVFNILIIPISYIAFQSGGSPNIAFVVGLLIEIIVQIASIFILKRIIEFSVIKYFKEIILRFIVVVFVSFPLPFISLFFIDEGLLRLLFVLISSVISSFFAIYFVGLDDCEKKVGKDYIKKIKYKLNSSYV